MTAELERDFISERTKEGLKARVAKGIKLGKPKGTLQSSMYDKDQEKYCIYINLVYHYVKLFLPIWVMVNICH